MYGTVRGCIRATKLVEIMDCASLEGDIYAPRVILAEGAMFSGGINQTNCPEVAPEEVHVDTHSTQVAEPPVTTADATPAAALVPDGKTKHLVPAPEEIERMLGDFFDNV